MKYIYLSQKYDVAYWKVVLKPASMHSVPNGNSSHLFVMHKAVGGRSPVGSSVCEVSDVFIQHECKQVPLRKIPREMRNFFNRTKLS
jgi:hypothetical protein